MKSKLFYVCGWIYRLTFQIVFNIVFNFIWLAVILLKGEWFSITKKIEELILKVKNFDELMKQYEKFNYRYDGIIKKAPVKWLKWLEMWPTWTCCIRVLIYRGYRGNCQDAAYYAAWLSRVYNYKHIFGQKVFIKTRIYVPLSLKLVEKIHYFVTIRYYGINYQFDNGKVKHTGFVNIPGGRLKNTDYIWLQ